MFDGYKYAKSHEWAKLEGDIATVGISDHAQVCAACPEIRVQGAGLAFTMTLSAT